MNRSGRGQLPLQQSDYTPRRPALLSQPGYKKPVGNQTAQQENKIKKKKYLLQMKGQHGVKAGEQAGCLCQQ